MALNAELSAEEIQSFGGKNESPDHFWKAHPSDCYPQPRCLCLCIPPMAPDASIGIVLAVESHDMALCEAAAVLLGHDMFI